MGDLKFLWVSGNLDMRGDSAMLLSDVGTRRRVSLCEERLQPVNPAKC